MEKYRGKLLGNRIFSQFSPKIFFLAKRPNKNQKKKNWGGHRLVFDTSLTRNDSKSRRRDPTASLEEPTETTEMSIIKPIGPTSAPQPYSIKYLPPLIVGGAVFNTQYASDPYKLPVKEIVSQAFRSGLIAIDTSPYYGASEELLGKALFELKSKWNRELYFICTKAGRIKLNEFDYSRDAVRKSVERSLSRLNTKYLDLVYMHDIEFVKEDDIYEALKELSLMKREGIIKNIGISGYPVEFLYKIAKNCHDSHQDDIGSLDVVMSYSNGCIQNTKLFEYHDKFLNECGLQKLLNGSILSMSLLRSQVTHDFHPASPDLKNCISNIAQNLIKEDQVELADLSTRFALRHWLFGLSFGKKDSERPGYLRWNKKVSIVLGVSSVEELNVAINCYWQVKLNEDGVNDKDTPLEEKVHRMLGHHLNETWPSGINH